MTTKIKSNINSLPAMKMQLFKKEGIKIMLQVCFLPAALFCMVSCGRKTTKEKSNAPGTDSNAVYYPINDFIRQQIQEVDSTPYYLYRLQVVNDKKDSSVESRPAFNAEIKRFLLPELEASSFRQGFTEAVFDDESTNSITLTYTPKSNSGFVQNASVLLNKENQSVKWIFINTLSTAGDSTTIQRIGWQGGESCYLNTLVTYNSKQPERQSRLSFVWNKKKEE